MAEIIKVFSTENSRIYNLKSYKYLRILMKGEKARKKALAHTIVDQGFLF
jgi:hypothetical protein